MNTERSFKCRICGGEVTWEKGSSMGECIYCGSKQPIPSNLTAHTQDLYNDAFEYLKKNEYDKAFVVYENIIKENPTDAEAYWGRCLCRYGIEYVDDPNTGKKIPTCHRLQAKSILKDEDYLSALKFAPDEATKSLYTMRATTIDVIQRDIISISQGEEGKYDIFISFKDTDNNENRTKDSHLAEEIYNELTKQGYKVFFSRVTLAQKLGAVYEPYIYAAIHSAKIMIVVGTKPEYIESAWVRNEWSRYLDLIREGNDKKLIVCFKDMSRKALPEEFVPFQNLDMNERGSMVALIQNIEKIVTPSKKEVKEPTPKKAKKSGCSGCRIPLLIVLGIIGAIIYFAWGPIQNLWYQIQYEAGIIDTPVNGDNGYQNPVDDALYYNDLQYEEYGSNISIVGYRGTGSNVDIPETINGKKVISITSFAFKNCSTIEKVVIPKSVKTIEWAAFYGCNSLKEIVLPFVGEGRSVEQENHGTLGYIFGDDSPENDDISTSNYHTIYKTSEGNNMTTQAYSHTGSGYHQGSSSWYSAGVDYYSYYAIPKSLRKVTVTDQSMVPAYAFRNCDLIVEITFEKELSSIDKHAFENCSSLSIIKYQMGSASLIQEYAFANCDSIEEISIQEGVLKIGAYAFSGNDWLKTVMLPMSLQSIENHAFSDCMSLTDVNIQNGCKTIKKLAFKNCGALQTITIPKSVNELGWAVFYGCNGLKDLTIPFIGQNRSTEQGNHGTLGYIFGDDSPENDEISNSNYHTVYKTSESKNMTTQAYSHTGSGYHQGSSAWYSCGVDYYSYYAIPKSLRKITVTDQSMVPAYAFRNCDLIVEIAFEQVLATIGAQAFEGCSSIKTVYYEGTQAEWKDIVFGADWNKNANDFSIVYNKQ